MDDSADPAKDLELARSFLGDASRHAAAMAARLQIVARIVPLLNRRRGSGLDSHELADLVQDVTLLALRKLAEYQGRGSLDAWLYALCDFELLNRCRRVRRQRARERTGTETAELPAAEPLVPADDSVNAALVRLGGYEADIIRMRCLDGLDFSDIAAALRLTVPNVKSRYYRGLQRLQYALGGALPRAEQA
jgi:RNA polymerase sigma factor (sigma-70 family)